MMRAGWMLCLLVWAAGTQAQDINFPLLIQQNESRIQRPAPDMLVLELPGPVIVTCQQNGCVGVDHSGHGAAGCALRVVTQLVALNAICPDALAAANKARLARYFEEGWQFWGANTVPAQDALGITAARTQALQAASRQLGGICPIDGSARGDDLRAMMISATRDTIAGRFAKVFKKPRLPVTDPCQ